MKPLKANYRTSPDRQMAQPGVRGPRVKGAAFPQAHLNLDDDRIFKDVPPRPPCRMPPLAPSRLSYRPNFSAPRSARFVFSGTFHTVLESPVYKLLLISEPSIDCGLGWGSVSVEWMNEPQESSPGLWTQMPCKARQTIQMNGVGDG